MNFFEQELRRFTGKDTAFKSSKPVYAGRTCFITLSGNRRARLEFVTCGVADHFEALDVTIFSTVEGKIDQLRLRFRDCFTLRKGGCSGTVCPHIWIDCGEAEWYVAPTSLEIKAMRWAIPSGISIWRFSLKLSFQRLQMTISRMKKPAKKFMPSVVSDGKTAVTRCDAICPTLLNLQPCATSSGSPA